MDKNATVVNNSEHSSKLGTFLHPISRVVARRKGPNDALPPRQRRRPSVPNDRTQYYFR
jgi:hypothetical protein